MRKQFVWIFVALMAAACDDAVTRQATPAGPTEPAAPSGPISTTGSYSLWIVSGADASPVRGAAVLIEGQTYQSDEKGRVVVAAPLGAWAVDVEAVGFLPRRTTTAVNQTLALWPVANEAEAQAVRQMIYQRGGARDGVLYPPDAGPFYVTMSDPSFDRANVPRAWAEEAKSFGAMFGLAYEFPGNFQYETNEIAVTFAEGNSAGCAPIPGWGFCRSSPWYKSFAVPPRLAADPATIRRVLASWFLGPNPLPGFMNPETPADSLSPLEVQTIRMVLQRPLKNRWPDDDRW